MSKLKQVTQVADNASPLAKLPSKVVSYAEKVQSPLKTVVE